MKVIDTDTGEEMPMSEVVERMLAPTYKRAIALATKASTITLIFGVHPTALRVDEETQQVEIVWPDEFDPYEHGWTDGEEPLDIEKALTKAKAFMCRPTKRGKK